MNSRKPPLAGPTRRGFALGALSAVGLSACAGPGEFVYQMGLVKEAATNFTKREKLTRDYIAQIPAASMSVRIGRKGESLFLLSKAETSGLIWRADRALLVTRGGRILQSAHLPYNLLDTTFNTPDPVNGELMYANGRVCVRVLDFDSGSGRAFTAESRFQQIGPDPMEIMEVTQPLIKIMERVHVREFSWRFKNFYWVDPDSGFVWRSIQSIHPLLPRLTVMTLRRPAAV